MEPLLINNYYLGYEIQYKLEDFEYDFGTKRVNYSGYARFIDMGTAIQTEGDDMQARLENYKGSMLHFKRAFYANQLESQGFEMRSLGKMLNPEKSGQKDYLASIETPLF